jgi:p21-activated kinase 1
MMSVMRCPNIVTFHRAHRVGQFLWILMEFMTGGSLTNVAKQCEPEECHIAYFAREVLTALHYMHSQKKIHRDIKTDNVLVHEDGTVKLTDFGYTVQLSNSEDSKREIVGTPYWMAPEVIKNDRHSFPADIWSLGIMCRELADGEPPLVDLPPRIALQIIVTKGIPEISKKHTRSPQFLDFLSKCLRHKPADRATAATLLKHPFLWKASDKSHIPPLLRAAKRAAEPAEMADETIEFVRFRPKFLDP